jgi:hypothetical protein
VATAPAPPAVEAQELPPRSIDIDGDSTQPSVSPIAATAAAAGAPATVTDEERAGAGDKTEDERVVASEAGDAAAGDEAARNADVEHEAAVVSVEAVHRSGPPGEASIPASAASPADTAVHPTVVTDPTAAANGKIHAAAANTAATAATTADAATVHATAPDAVSGTEPIEPSRVEVTVTPPKASAGQGGGDEGDQVEVHAVEQGAATVETQSVNRGGDASEAMGMSTDAVADIAGAAGEAGVSLAYDTAGEVVAVTVIVAGALS